MTFVPIAIFWLLVIWAAFSSRPVVLYLFFASIPFGAFAVIPTELTAGVTFTATPIISLLLIAKVLLHPKGPDFLLTTALRPERLLFLFLFWLVAVVTTLFMPRLFAGEVRIVPIRGNLGETIALFPTMQNLTQVIYITISVFTVFAFARILQSRVDRQRALAALVFGGAVIVVSGLIDFATQFAPIEPLLAPLRTATYAMATNVEVLGSKRVVGFMPEASAFGGITLAALCLLIFFRRVIQNARLRNVYAPLVIAGLALCLWLAKSSGAYLGAAVLIIVVVAEALLRAFSRGRSGRLHRGALVSEMALVVGMLVAAGMLVILSPATFEPVLEVLDRMVFSKAESGSFEERAFWRNTAFEALLSTYGLGVGLGGTRSSSSFVAIFASTGLLGGLLYFTFVLQTLLRGSRHMDDEGQMTLSAFRFAFIPPFVASLFVGGANLTALNAFGFGIVTATVIAHVNLQRKRHSSHSFRGQRAFIGQPVALSRPAPAKQLQLPPRAGGAPG